ncbi:MAG: hypothetical protein GY906_17925 [bacterium]|nr:hypothetical protein [bacterium]
MKLTPKHKAALELIANPLDTRSNEAKAKAAGISVTTLWRVLKEPGAVKYVNDRTTELLRTIRPEAYQCLMRGIRSGDRASARDALQACGDIGSGGNSVSVNVGKPESDEEFTERVDRLLKKTAGEG